MYKEILESLPMLKISGVVTRSGMSRHCYETLENRLYEDRKALYRDLLKALRSVAEDLDLVRVYPGRYEEFKDIVKLTVVRGLNTQEEVSHLAQVTRKNVKEAYDDLLKRYKNVREEEEFEELASTEQLSLFDEVVEEPEVVAKEDTMTFVKRRPATPEERAKFLKMEATVERGKR